MGKQVNLSFKVDEEVHKKLKILSAVSGKAMSDIVVDFIKSQKVDVPVFDDTPKPKKTAKPRKPTKPGKRKDQNPNADEEVIKAAILKHKQAGLSLQKIADALAADEIPSLRGGQWRAGTVDGLLRKWDRPK